MTRVTAPTQSATFSQAFVSPAQVGRAFLLSTFTSPQASPQCQSRPRRSRFAQRTSPRSSLLLSTALTSGAITTLQSSAPALLSLAQKGVPANLVLYVLARVVGQNMLTSAGLLHALYLGSLLWSCGGPGVYALCLSFLVVGSALTRLRRAQKEAAGIAEKRGGARGPENLWGAAGAASLCAIAAAILRAARTAPLSVPTHPLLVAETCLWCAYNGAIASKFADTSSSEVGKAYGSKTYLVTTWREVARGTEGAVSLEGTAAGVIASVVAALLGWALGVLRSPAQVGVVVAAATAANLFESWLGAAVQDRYEFTNEQVNFLNTAFGALVAGLGCYLLVLLGGIPL